MKHRFQFCLLSIIVCMFLMVSYISISAHAKAIYDDEEKVFANEDDEPWRVYREKEFLNQQSDYTMGVFQIELYWYLVLIAKGHSPLVTSKEVGVYG